MSAASGRYFLELTGQFSPQGRSRSILDVIMSRIRQALKWKCSEFQLCIDKADMCAYVRVTMKVRWRCTNTWNLVPKSGEKHEITK